MKASLNVPPDKPHPQFKLFYFFRKKSVAHTEVFTVSGAYVIFQVVLYLGIKIVSFLILQSIFGH